MWGDAPISDPDPAFWNIWYIIAKGKKNSLSIFVFNFPKNYSSALV